MFRNSLGREGLSVCLLSKRQMSVGLEDADNDWLRSKFQTYFLTVKNFRILTGKVSPTKQLAIRREFRQIILIGPCYGSGVICPTKSHMMGAWSPVWRC